MNAYPFAKWIFLQLFNMSLETFCQHKTVKARAIKEKLRERQGAKR